MCKIKSLASGKISIRSGIYSSKNSNLNEELGEKEMGGGGGGDIDATWEESLPGLRDRLVDEFERS